MTNIVYDFATQLALGEEGEAILDRFFARWYRIEKLDKDMQFKSGADRLFVGPDGQQTLVEYKTDFKAHQTGNVIVEIISADSHDSVGWAIKSRADIMVLFVYHSRKIVILKMEDVREQILWWNAKYRKVAIHNAGYNTIGIVLPLYEYESIAIRVFDRVDF